MMIEGDLCIDSYEFDSFNDYYHVSFENEYGSGDGEISMEISDDNRVYLELWAADNNRVILEYNCKDSSDILHVKHYLFEYDALRMLTEKLKNLN